MKKKYIYISLLIALLLSQICIYSQPQITWTQIFGGPSSTDLYQNLTLRADAAGNTYILGFHTALLFYTEEYFIYSYNTNGVERFQYIEQHQVPSAYIIDEHNNFFVGSHYSIPSVVNEVLRYNAGFLWKTTNQWDYAPLQVCSDIAGNCFVLFQDTVYTPFKIKKYGPTGNDVNTCVLPDSINIVHFTLADSNYIVSCIRNNVLNLYKISPGGSVMWNSTYSPANSVFSDIKSITYTSSGSIFLLCSYVFSGGGRNYTVLKYNSLGEQQWAATYGGGMTDAYPNEIIIDNPEKIFVTGNVATLCFNSSGQLQWTDSGGMAGIVMDKNHDLVGMGNYGGGIYLAKILNNGIRQWTYYYVSPNGPITTRKIDIDTSGNIYAAGMIMLPDDGQRGVTLKFSQSPLHTVSGTVRYGDNNQPVSSGHVKALRYDSASGSIITVDTATVQSNGSYTLFRCPPIPLDFMGYQDDELDFAPTYYDTTIYWKNAITITPSGNLENIDIKVKRITNPGGGPRHISGYINSSQGNPLAALENAYIYALSGNLFRNYGVSQSNGYFIVDSLSDGTYTLIVDRMGYNSVTVNLVVSGSNIENQNIVLDRVTALSNESEIPVSYSLMQNYPNPFNPTTLISYNIPKKSFVTLKVYDISGRLVSTLLDNIFSFEGIHSVAFDCSSLASGVYFYTLEAGEYKSSKKMVLLK